MYVLVYMLFSKDYASCMKPLYLSGIECTRSCQPAPDPDDKTARYLELYVPHSMTDDSILLERQPGGV